MNPPESYDLKKPVEKPVVMAETITIRRAVPDDVPSIVSLVNSHAINGEILPRTTEAVYATIDDWIVASAGDESYNFV